MKELDMTIDLDTHRDPTGFPIDHPMDALKKDHDLMKQLFDRYLEIQHDMDEKEDISYEILLRLNRHMSMEENVFYPRVRDVDAELVKQCEAEHQHARQLMKQIRAMEESDAKIQAFQQLADAISMHVDTEEKVLFPEVIQANIDLTEIGMEMQAFELSMVASEAPSLQKPERRL
jgi:hemerythrin superfamily protein